MKMSFLISRDSKFLYQKLEQMEIENAELDNKNNELEEEIAELKEKLKGFENGEVAWQGDMDKTIKQNLELKQQIEKYSKMLNYAINDFLNATSDSDFFVDVEVGMKSECFINYKADLENRITR